MTIEEYRTKLNEITDDQFEEFRAKFGGAWKTREEYVREHARDPRHERLICYFLGLKTEQEKWADAALSSAEAAASSAKTAKIACAMSLGAVVVGILTLILNA